MTDKTFEKLEEKVLEWAGSHDLLHEENANKQFMKFIEEVFEFKTEFDYNGNEFIVCLIDKRMKFTPDTFSKMKLEMGDIIVILIILCYQLDIDPTECLEMAYNKIKDRQGKTVNGTFVKAEDLKE